MKIIMPNGETFSPDEIGKMFHDCEMKIRFNHTFFAEIYSGVKLGRKIREQPLAYDEDGGVMIQKTIACLCMS